MRNPDRVLRPPPAGPAHLNAEGRQAIHFGERERLSLAVVVPEPKEHTSVPAVRQRLLDIEPSAPLDTARMVVPANVRRRAQSFPLVRDVPVGTHPGLVREPNTPGP